MCLSKRKFLQYTAAEFTEILIPEQRLQVSNLDLKNKLHIYFNFNQAIGATKDGAFMISQGGIMFPFKWKLTGHKKTVLFMPGRTAREKPIPSFQRSSYFKDLPYNCISCFDPTLFYSPSLTLGWYQGRRNVFFCSILAKLMQQMISALNVRGEDLLIYGTSGGGIPGFNVAASIPGSTLYVSNIQSDAARYIPKAFSAMAKISYPDDKEVDLAIKYPQRLAVHHIDAPFNLIYAQNLEDDFHYKNHFLPYAKSASGNKSINKTLITYSDKESGHGPLPRETELAMMNRLLDGQSVFELLPNAEFYDQEVKLSDLQSPSTGRYESSEQGRIP